LETARHPSSPIGPAREKPILIVGILSTFLGVAVVLFFEYANTTIRTPEDIEKAYNLTVLAEIGRYNKSKKK
jgi:capsular polysaccharide biosynthesis protein